jgi:hypothetical protein
VVVVTGDLDAPWRREDVSLTIEVAKRIVAFRPAPVAIFTTETGEPAGYLDELPDAEVTTGHAGREVLEALLPGDLVLIPPRVVGTAAGLGRWLLSRHLQGVSIAVIAGPGRLSVTSAGTHRSFHGAVAARG